MFFPIFLYNSPFLSPLMQMVIFPKKTKIKSKQTDPIKPLSTAKRPSMYNLKFVNKPATDATVLLQPLLSEEFKH